MIAELLVLASLLRLDPSGDAHGAGNLQPPTAALYASVAPFDLVQVEVLDTATLTVRVTFAEIANPLSLPNGISLPILEVYLDVMDGGHTELLQGSGLAMPSPYGWDIAFRVDGDDAFIVVAGAGGDEVVPLDVRVVGDALDLATTLPAPTNIRRLDAITGVYDPFSADGWRGLTPSPSPWAFSSSTAAPPVIDVLASDATRQAKALERFELPREERTIPPSTWLTLSMIGVVLVIAGYGSRGRAGGTSPSEEDVAAEELEGLLIADEDLADAEEASDVDPHEDVLIDLEAMHPGNTGSTSDDAWSFPVDAAPDGARTKPLDEASAHQADDADPGATDEERALGPSNRPMDS